MKTAISIPDETFARATQVASAHGISRSQLVTRAVQTYLEQLEEQSLTAVIDEVVALSNHDHSAAVAVAAGRQKLERGEDDW